MAKQKVAAMGGFNMPDIAVTEDEEPAGKTDKGTDDPIARLAELIAQSQKGSEQRMTALEKNLDRLAATLSQPRGERTQAATQDADPELPDPVTRPKEYAKALAEHVAGKVQNTLKGTQSAQEERRKQEARWEGLWSRFGTKHPKLAEKQIVMRASAAELRKNYDLQGIDLEARAFGNEDAFFKDLHGIAVGAIGADPDAMRDEEDDSEPKEVDRTGGLRGGSAVPRGGKKAGEDEGKNVPNFIDQMKELSPRAAIVKAGS